MKYGVLCFFMLLFFSTPLSSTLLPTNKVISVSNDTPSLSPSPILLYTTGHVDEYVLAFSKDKQKLDLYHHTHNIKLRKLYTFAATSGKRRGNKVVVGDLKTPNGIYSFLKILEKEILAPRYGVRAFVTNYPNIYDSVNKKTGSGIWLHGLNRPLKQFDTKGCIALRNEDLDRLTKFISLNNTRIIIGNDVNVMSPMVAQKTITAIKNLLLEWSNSWQTKDIDSYISHYSEKFKSGKMNKRQWYWYKKGLNEKYDNISIKLSDEKFSLFQNQLIVTVDQEYSSTYFKDNGIKTLYFIKEKGIWKILSENWVARPSKPSISVRNIVKYKVQ